MTSSAQQHSAQAARSQPLGDLCQQAIALIERAQHEQPSELSEDVDEAERTVVRLRDQLIERLRRGDSSGEVQSTQSALTTVNAALSLIVGVEYPAAGIQRKLLEQAGAALRKLLESGQLGNRS